MATNLITFSSELIKNYKQAEVMSPEANITALQTDTGCSILYSIGTNGIFYATEETPGHTTGWVRHDLSSAIIKKDFSTVPTAACTAFSAAQNVQNGTLGLAMVISGAANDELYLCLGNSNSSTGWLANPNWTKYSYDDVNDPINPVKIVDVFLSETMNGQYIVVDILRNIPNQANPDDFISRFYIDTAKNGGHAWHPHNLTIDLSAKKYVSCLGRKKGQSIDGLYTCGQVNGLAQFIYLPLYNFFNPSLPALPDRLHLPGNLVPDTLASCRNSDESTDLYAAANGGLYYFASTNQFDGAQGVLLINNPLLQGVRNLYVFTYGTLLYVWGLNGADQVFYLSCQISQINTPGAWSYPLPLLEGVEQVTPYINLVNGGNTFFAHTGANQLTKAVKSNVTTFWNLKEILLPQLTNTTPAFSHSSYTTRIQLTDSNSQPLSYTSLLISSDITVSVYINNLYYILSTTPIPVLTDAIGSITIIEFVNDLSAAQITVSENGTNAVKINPMEKPLGQIASLTTPTELKGAVIRHDNGTTSPLLPSGIASKDIDSVAEGNQILCVTYNRIVKPKSPLSTPSQSAPVATDFLDFGAGIISAFVHFGEDIGDIFQSLKNDINHEFALIKDKLSGFWKFIVRISGQEFSCLIDDLHKVANVLLKILKTIKIAFEDFFMFLKYCFEWKDITRTKEVLKNFIKLFCNEILSEVTTIQAKFDSEIATVEKQINKWAGLGNMNNLGTIGSSNINSKSTPVHGLDTPSTFLSHHFNHNATQMVNLTTLAIHPPSQHAVDIFINKLITEGKILHDTLEELKDIIADISKLSLADLLKKLTAVVAETVLSTAKDVIDTIFELLELLLQSIFDVLDTQVYIPVISDILKDFGVHLPSLLDVICFVNAVPVTICYKIQKGKAPFPDNAQTNFLKTITDYTTLVDACTKASSGTTSAPAVTSSVSAATAPVANVSQAPASMLLSVKSSSATTASQAATSTTTNSGQSIPPGGLITLDEEVLRAVFATGQLAAGFSSVGLALFETGDSQQSSSHNDFAFPALILSLVAGGADAIANILVPVYPISNASVLWTNRSVTALRLAAKAFFSGPAQSFFNTRIPVLHITKARQIGALVDAVFVIPLFVCTVLHFNELLHDNPGKDRSVALLQETSNVSFFCARIAYAVAVISSDSIVKKVAGGVLAVSDITTGGLHIAEGMLYLT